MTIRNFEDLECWKESRKLNRGIYKYANYKYSSKDYRLSGQITGASISIMNNISEDFDAGSNNEFIRFLFYARRSCSEVQNCLYIAIDIEYIKENEFQGTYKQCERVRMIIDGLIRSIRKRTKNSNM
jgi:four helix bundle protein